MLEPVIRGFYIVCYFFYYLVQGKDEWKHKNGKPSSAQKPASIPTCCQESSSGTSTIPLTPQTAHVHDAYLPSSPNTYTSQPKPYFATYSNVSQSSWLERWFPRNGQVRRYASKIWDYVKVIPLYIWQGLKWLFWAIVGFFAYLGRSFLNIFTGKSVDEAEVFGIEPKSYTYRRIEPPSDYREVDAKQEYEKHVLPEVEAEPRNWVSAPNETPKEAPVESESEKEEQKEKAEERESNITPISFYTRRQSLPRVGTSPPPPAPPPPPDKPVRIPSSLDLASAGRETPKPEVKPEKLKAEGAVAVLPPSLMQEFDREAKAAHERRSKTPTNFIKQQYDEEKARLHSHQQQTHQPVVTQLPPSHDEPDSSRYVFKTRKHSMPEYVLERSLPREIPRERSTPRDILRDRSIPREPIRKQLPEIYDKSDHHPAQQVPRWQNSSPAPYLLGRPVFTPVDEVERIRDQFNRKTESRASSVAFSREPSMPQHMANSYHADYNRDKTASPIVTFRDSSVEAPSIRHRLSTSAPRPWNQDHSLQTKWTLRTTNEEEPLTRIPISSRRVVERKVTERHYEKDSDGQLLNGWKEQCWMGHVEEANEAGKVTFRQAYETNFEDAKPI